MASNNSALDFLQKSYNSNNKSNNLQGSNKGSAGNSSLYEEDEEEKKEKERSNFEKGLERTLEGVTYLGHRFGLGFIDTVEGTVDYLTSGVAKILETITGNERHKDFYGRVLENDWLNYDAADEWFDPGQGWKFFGDVASGVGQQVYTWGIGALTGGVGLVPAAFFSGAGNAAQEAYKETGKFEKDEVIYSNVMGGIEAGLELFLPAGGAKIAKSIGKSLGLSIAKESAKDVVASTGKNLIKKGLKEFFSEGIEEAFTEFITPYVKRETYDEDAEDATAGEIIYSGIVGGLTGLFGGGIDTWLQQRSNRKAGKEIEENGSESSVLSLADMLSEIGGEVNKYTKAIQEDIAWLADSLTEKSKANREKVLERREERKESVKDSFENLRKYILEQKAEAEARAAEAAESRAAENEAKAQENLEKSQEQIDNVNEFVDSVGEKIQQGKETISEKAEEITSKLSDGKNAMLENAKDLRNKVSDLIKSLESKATEAGENVIERLDDGRKSVENLLNEIGEKAQQNREKAQANLAEGKESISNLLDSIQDKHKERNAQTLADAKKLKETLSRLIDKIEARAKAEVKQAVSDGVDKATDFVEGIKDKASENNAKVKDAVNNGKEIVTNGIVSLSDYFAQTAKNTAKDVKQKVDDAKAKGKDALNAARENILKIVDALENGVKLNWNQKRILGEIRNLETNAIFEPIIKRSALSVIEGAEAVANKLNLDGVFKMVGDKLANVKEKGFDAKGEEVRDITADDIRKGITSERNATFKDSIADALKNNEVLRFIAASDAAGRIMMNAKETEKAAATGTKIKTPAEFSKFLSESSQQEKNALAKELGVEDLDSMSFYRFNKVVNEYRESGKAAKFQEKIRINEQLDRMKMADAEKMPTKIDLKDGEMRRYSDGNDDIAVVRKGKEYIVHDFKSNTYSNPMSKSRLDTLLGRKREINNTAKADKNALSMYEDKLQVDYDKEAPFREAKARIAQQMMARSQLQKTSNLLTNTPAVMSAANAKEETRATPDTNIAIPTVPNTDGNSSAAKAAAAAVAIRNAENIVKQKIVEYDQMDDAKRAKTVNVFKSAIKSGISTNDSSTYARVSARTGLDIVFDKEACKSGNGTYYAGYYDPDNNRIVVNPETKKRHSALLIHELSHAIRSYTGKDNKIHYLADKNAKISPELWEKVKKHYADQNVEVNRMDLYLDEASAYYAEEILGTDAALDLLLGKKKTLKEKILSFFRGAIKGYAGDEALTREARKFYRSFKKMFDAFEAKNQMAEANNQLAEAKSQLAEVKDQIAEAKDQIKEAKDQLAEAKDQLAETKERSENIRAAMEEGDSNAKRGAAEDDYNAPITISDISNLRAIGIKSVNDFTARDIEVTRKWAHKFYKELGVKSPFFRAWFGEWRAHDKSRAKIITVPTIDISQAQLYSGNYKINDTGWDVYAGKTLNDDTRHHSGGQRINVKALNVVESILNNSILLDTIVSKPDTNKKSPNTAFLHKLYTLIEYENQMYISKVSVEEFYNQGKNGISRKAYNLKAIKIEPAGGQFRIKNSSSSVPVTDSTYSISDLYEFVKSYDKDFSPAPEVNKVLLNDDGTPKIFYHGTEAKFTEFSPDEMSSREGSYFFAENREDAAAYGKNIYNVYLSARKLADYDNQPTEFYRLRNKRDQVAWLKERGYDGWYADMESDGWGELSVFSPKQIKSATDNIGTFSKFSNDIRYAVEEESTESPTIGNVAKSRFDAPKPKMKAKIKAGFTSAKDKLYIEGVDELYGVEKYLKKFGGRKDAEAFVQQVRASETIAQTMIGLSQYDIMSGDGTRLGDGISKIFKPYKIRKIEDQFNDYLLHQLNVDRMTLRQRSNGELDNKPVFGKNEKRDHDITAEESKKIIAAYEKKYSSFKADAEKVWSYSKNLLNMRVKAGLISQEAADLMNRYYPHYVPSFRVDAKSVGASAVKNDSQLGVNSTVKRAKGGSSDIYSIEESIAAQTRQAIRAMEINMMANAVYDAAIKSGDTSYVIAEEVETEKNADPDKDIDVDLIPKNNQIVFFKDGKRIEMNVAKEIFDGFKGVTSGSVPDMFITRMANRGVNAFKNIVTSYSPAFTVRNFVRDLQDAGINSKHSALWAKNIPLAIGGIATNDVLWQQYLAYGGYASTVFDGKGFTNGVGGRGFEALKKWSDIDGNFIKKAPKFLKNILVGIGNANAFVEQVTRFAEFRASIEAGDSIQTAINNSADVTTNFSRHGKSVKVLNATFIPFLNASVQGFDKLLRVIAGPFKEKSLKAIAMLLAKILVIGVGFQVLNMVMNGDDEEYYDLTDEVRENYFLIKVGDQFIKIPRGRAAAAFGGVANRIGNEMRGDDFDVQGYLTSLKDNVTPVDSFSRNILSPFKDLATNTTWYGGEIEGRQFDNVRPSQRYDESTSSIAIAIAHMHPEAWGVSPKKVHYLLDQYSGVIGDFLLPATTKKAEKDYLSANFLIDSTTNNKLSNDFYKLYDEAMYASEEGDMTAYYQLRHLNDVKESVSKLYDQINEIQNSDLKNAEKLQQVRTLRVLINNIYRTAAVDYAAYKKAIEATDGMFDDSDDSGKRDRHVAITQMMYGSEKALEEYNKTVYEKSALFNKAGISYDTFYEYYFGVRDLESDVDKNGEVIEGSKKKKVEAAVKSMGVDSRTRALLLMASGYSVTDSEKRSIASYIQSLDLTEEEFEELAKACGFKVKNGRIQL